MSSKSTKVYANTYWQGTKKCFSCQWRLRRLTGGCNITTLASGGGYWGDDMYGCEEYKPLKKETNNENSVKC